MTNVDTAQAGAQLNRFKHQYPHINRFLGALEDLDEQLKALKTLATSEVFRATYPDFARMISISTTMTRQFFDKKEDVLDEIRKEIASLFNGEIPVDLAMLISDFEDDPTEPASEIPTDLGDLVTEETPQVDLGNIEAPVDPNAVPYTFICGNNTFSFAEADREVFATKVANKIKELRSQGIPEDELPANFQNLANRYLVDIARAIFDDRRTKRAAADERVQELVEYSAKTSTKG